VATAPLTAPAWLEEVGQRSEILRLTAERQASDVHIQAGLPPVLRILTRRFPLEGATLDAAAKLLGILERSLWYPVKKLKIQVQEAR
jgi:Tfp pilus assembly pilus retraction ATPase PilT